MIRLADYIARYLADTGVRHVFMLTGGGAMHLNDAFGLEKRIQVICNHHEQGCAIAAEGYARISGKLGVVCVTTGPGGTNTLTGVLGQWLDSIPVLYISGQVRYDTTALSTGLPLRQLGDQEANIVEIVRPITKYAVMVTDSNEIRYHLEKAIYLATNGRPGPVWLDIPLNIQASMVDEENLHPFIDQQGETETILSIDNDLIDRIIERLIKSERPVLFGGAGVRLSGAADDFYRLAEKLGIPVQVAWDAIDLFPSDHRLYAGRPSTLGQRGANFVFQNSDLLLSIGCRLNVRQIGYTFPAVARAAYKISVDTDPVELQKPTLKIDLPVQADAGSFIHALYEKLEGKKIPPKTSWISWCHERIERYPVTKPKYKTQKKSVNPYIFADTLSRCLNEKDIVVSSNGASCVIPIQVMEIKHGQRHLVNSGCAAMGYGLPAALGAAVSLSPNRVICLEGDGSIQLNIQELETVVYHQLPLKIFIFSNGGYLSIRTTQNSFFDGNLIGESEKSGVGFPDFVRLARAYKIKAYRITSQTNLREKIEKVLLTEGPVVCDVRMDPNQQFSPRITSKRLPNGQMVSSPLEDMYPFLSESELASNMLIPLWKPQ